MAFRRTSEGRVFFKSDEESKPANGGPPHDDQEPSRRDQSQMQILILLKSLNAKLMETQDERAVLKEELTKYREELKALEEKAERSEKSYIDLEQKFATKQNETFKKASRVEETIKETAKELETARNLVESLEGKAQDNDEALKSIKEDLTQRKKLEDEILALHKTLEEQQKEQAEKTSENMSSLLALTKRIGESEARQEALDNKIEEATTDFLKLDRKINKAIEDRTRLLRKMERLEETVQETREALNAKAMVLLTSKGRITAADYPQIEDGTSPPLPLLQGQHDDKASGTRSFWKRPFQIEASALILIVTIGLLLGWMISELKQPQRETTQPAEAFEKISWNKPLAEEETDPLADPESSEISEVDKLSENNRINPVETPPVETAILTEDETPPPPEEQALTETEHPTSEGNLAKEQADSIDTAIQSGDEKTLMAAFEENPDAVAARLNEIEPSGLTEGDLTSLQEPEESTNDPVALTEPVPEQETEKLAPKTLKEKMAPDPDLPAEIRKVEEQAYAGVGEAQHDMGALYIADQGPLKKNLDRAIFWFREAADNGIPNAKYNMGVLYHQGIGVKPDLDKALDLYAQAASLGHPEAQYNLGIAYIGGIGYPYDPAKAAVNFESAAKSGVMEAAYNLGLIYENGLLGKPQPDEALMWYKEAADKGSPEAKAALEQLAESLGITIQEVNRIVDSVKSAKKAAQPDKAAKNGPLPSAPKPPQKTTSANNAPSAAPHGKSPATSDTKNNMIAGIQSELMERGLYPGPVDGKIGPVTTDAIRTYQSAANMETVDGKPTQELLNFMKSSPGSQSADSKAPPKNNN